MLATLSPAIIAKELPMAKADIKPALSNDNIDDEEMRLAKIIHKRVIQKQAAGANKNDFSKYQENIEKDLNLEMMPIEKGQFDWSGEQADDQLKVTLSSFWMASKEITWDQYDPFMKSEIPRKKNGLPKEIALEHLENDIDFLARPTVIYFPIAGGMEKDGHPVVSMTQHAANKYCQWLSFKTGHFYRLPTEAEWEYACRAGKKTNYSWGDDPASGSQYAWFGDTEQSHYKKPGVKKPNPWGLYDMHGNVMEWTLDQYVPNRKKYFQKEQVTNPWVKATKPYPHVAKGGHWKQKLEGLAVSKRYQSHPNWKIQDPQQPKSVWYHTDAQMLGFRIVRPVKIPTAEEMYHYWNSGVAEDGMNAGCPEGRPLHNTGQ